eukprot:707263-Amphidinium_carterae.1
MPLVWPTAVASGLPSGNHCADDSNNGSLDVLLVYDIACERDRRACFTLHTLQLPRTQPFLVPFPDPADMQSGLDLDFGYHSAQPSQPESASSSMLRRPALESGTCSN